MHGYLQHGTKFLLGGVQILTFAYFFIKMKGYSKLLAHIDRNLADETITANILIPLGNLVHFEA